MNFRSVTFAVLSALAMLSGCASTGGNNTTYADYQGAYPQPFLGAKSGANVGIPLN
ncbi:ABC-type uncharacterized transport system auxiliary subunit [Pararhizobium capsulatum DSM 1112]|uniref:ABC-type uncharacterized transport system auxiliary subunit n=1 Tax=Pararhizobium capsulatum DSM 1112 TaxID=1121113 RepID=A0ABU0BRS6_9HYPH|nr:hypothetical protein [Pararhizobium capsulatum]MDQ0320424.1 ABC-type uncharacterized transport system auxiliary subunit [Pararhizobium capsulatum DSM 1112]